MSDTEPKTAASGQLTALSDTNESTQQLDHSAVRHCPKCGAECVNEQLESTCYRCPSCSFGMAHLEMTPTGAVRNVLGWIKSVGDIIGERYRVISVLGRGGFAATYLVEDINVNNRKRALKEIPQPLFDEQELHFLSRMDHPAIPDITDRLQADGMEYLVLKFAGHKTLDSVRQDHGGQIPFIHLRNWMLELCNVLDYLHSLDPPVIHRDLKPDNILLDDSDRITLIDFGIAKEAKPSEKTRMSGQAVTSGYSSPEQAMGTGTDQCSDIYSFAATFYKLLSGVTPQAADDRVIQGKKIIPLSQLVDGVPPSLEKILHRAMEINAKSRQQSIGELAAVIEGLDPAEATSGRTTMLDPAALLEQQTPTTTWHSKLKSVKLPKHQTVGKRQTQFTGDDTTAPTVSDDTPQHQQIATQPKRASKWLLIVGILLLVGLLAGAAVGSYFYWFKDNDSKPKPVDASKSAVEPDSITTGPATGDVQSGDGATIPKKPATADEIKTGDGTTTPVNPPTTGELETAPGSIPGSALIPLPGQTTAPSPNTQYREGSGSAMDYLRRNRVPQTGDVKPKTTTGTKSSVPKARAKPKAQSKPKVRSKPKPKAQSKPKVRSKPKPNAQSKPKTKAQSKPKPTWNIQRGTTRKN